MEISRNIKKRSLSSNSTSCSIIKSSSRVNGVVRHSRSGRIIDKNALADNLITRYDKAFRDTANSRRHNL